MPYQHIRVEASSPVARLTMSWPEKRNALSLHMMNKMTRGLKELSASPDVRVVVLAAEGTVFSAGHYLPEMAQRDLRHQRRIFYSCIERMDTIQSIP